MKKIFSTVLRLMHKPQKSKKDIFCPCATSPASSVTTMGNHAFPSFFTFVWLPSAKSQNYKFWTCAVVSLFMSLLFLPTYGMSVEGGVTYNADSAREYVFNGIPNGVEINQPYILKGNCSNIERQVSSYNANNRLIGITVLYKNELNKTYIYSPEKRLIYVEQYDRSVNEYPHRGYRYDLDGNLVLTSLTVSKEELFRFEPNGKLIVHSINGVIYDENGNIIGHGK